METVEPRLIVVTGMPGTGKSTTIKELCHMVSNTPLVEKDQFDQS